MACWGPVTFYLGVAAAAARRFDEAEEHFRQAIATSLRIEAPTFAAQARVECARTLLDRGAEADREAALELARAGAKVAGDFGLAALEERAKALIARVVESAPAADAPKKADRDRFVRDGRFWQISFAGNELRLPDSKGLGYIAVLLERAGTEVPVLDLAACVDGKSVEPEQRRLASLREELTEAEEWRDTGRVERLREEIARLAAAIARTYGLKEGGQLDGDAERARKAVTGRIRETVRRIAEKDAALAKHLDNSLRTGMLCSYRPDRSRAWRL
jgi:hypothetical protein